AVAAVAFAGVSGLPGLLARRDGRAFERLFACLMTAAAACAACAAGLALAGWPGALSAPWQVPGGELAITLDPIAAVFVLPIGLMTGLGAWYGLEYWPQRDRPGDGRKLRAFYGLVSAGMLLLVVAGNAILFLAGWELMAAAAFILVSTEDEQPAV